MARRFGVLRFIADATVITVRLDIDVQADCSSWRVCSLSRRLFCEFPSTPVCGISEALGLRWEHPELGENPHVKVREQVYEAKRRKLKSGDRQDVPLSPGMAQRLLKHRRDSYGFREGRSSRLRPVCR